MWGEEGGGYGNVGTAVERAVGKVSQLVQLKRRKTEPIYMYTHNYSSWSTVWALQLLCWKYSDLCILGMYVT